MIDKVEARTWSSIVRLWQMLTTVNRCRMKRRTNQYLEMPGDLGRNVLVNVLIPLVHISTDAVFDGKTGGYQEKDQPNPLSVYARTKLEGEKLVI